MPKSTEMWFLTDEEIEDIKSGSFGLPKPEEGISGLSPEAYASWSGITDD